MRESFGESWTIQLVAFFTILMIAFLSAMISYARSFKVKNEVISIIEKYGTYSDDDGRDSDKVIKNYLKQSNYIGTGDCPDDSNTWHKFSGTNSGNEPYNYCVSVERIDSNYVRYRVVVFYTFNLPALGNIASFEVNGKTHDLKKKDVDITIFGPII